MMDPSSPAPSDLSTAPSGAGDAASAGSPAPTQEPSLDLKADPDAGTASASGLDLPLAEQGASVPPPGPGATPPVPGRPSRRWLRRSAWTLLALSGLVAGTVFTPWGTRASLALVARTVPGLDIDGVSGSAWRGLHVKRLYWAHGQGGQRTAWTLHDLAWQGWQLERGGRHWQLHGLSIARVDGELASEASPDPVREPVTLSLHPWLSWTLHDVKVAQVHLSEGGQPLARLDQLSLDLAISPDAWRVDRLQLQWQRWRLQGQAELGAHRPFPTQLRLQAQETQAPVGAAPLTPWSPWQAQARVQGPLRDLQAQLQIKSPVQPVDVLQAGAQLRPFQPQPLVQAEVQAQGLDLRRLHDQAPQTRLQVQARWTPQPQGLAELVLDARNQLPGGLGEGRLPLSDLTAKATLRTAGGLALSRLDEARWRYQPAAGAMAVAQWQLQVPTGQAAGEWQLQMTLKEWPMQAWWPQGPQVVLGGRSDLSVRARRAGTAMPADWRDLVSLQWRPQLEARLTRLDGRVLPLSWSSEWLLMAPAAGDAQGDWQLSLPAWRMQSGAEQLALSGQWRWHPDGASPWPVRRMQGRAELQLTQFDPLTWWPVAGLPGGNRLQGQAQLQWQLQQADPLHGQAQLALELQDSQWLGSALQLKAKAELPSLDVRQSPPALAVDGQWGGNQFALKSVPGAEPAWLARANLQQSEVWAPLTDALKLPRVQLQGEWQAQGLWRDPAQFQAELKLKQLATQGWQAQGVQASWQSIAPGVKLEGVERLPAGAKFALQSLRWPGAPTGAGARQIAMQLVPDGPEAMAWSLSAELPGGVQVLPAALQERLPDGSQDLLTQGQGRWSLPGGRLDAGNWLAQLQAAARSVLEIRQLKLATRAGLSEAASPLGRPASGPVPAAAQLDLLRLEQATLTLEQDVVRPASASATRGAAAAKPVAASPLWRARWPGFRADVLGTSWQIQAGSWQQETAGSRWQFRAEMDPLPATRWLNQWRLGQGWGGDLQVRSWVAASQQPGQAPFLDARLERQSGDLSVQQGLEPTDRLPLGLEALRLGLHAEHGQWQLEQHFKGAALGQLKGRLAWLSAGWPQGSDEVAGEVNLDVQELGAWNPWLPSPWRVGGRVQGDVQLQGPLAALAAHGRLSASQLSVRQPLAGIRLQDGQLTLDWAGEEARVTEGRIRAGDGWLQLGGKASLGASPRLELTAQAERFAALSRVDRKLVVAGQSRLLLEGQRVQLEGQWKVLEGLWDISQSDAPSLDDDVVLPDSAAHGARQQAKGSPGAPERSVQLQLGIDLGEKFRLKGKGLDTRLGGQVTLTAPKGQLQIKGSIRTVEGQYAAYGQNLKIEQGRIDFTGPVANPLLDIQAVRPNLDVVVGVSIGGTAQNPRVRLFSEPDMPATEQLSWLVLGRGMDGLGRADTAVLQRAAWALLAREGQAGQTSGALGLDEFSVRQGDGSTKDTVLSLGKQISQRWYVGYERSLQQTTGTWQLVYRLAQRFTLRAQMGSETSVDALWNWKWDGQGAKVKVPAAPPPVPAAAPLPGAPSSAP